jgi:hypothetical protein
MSVLLKGVTLKYIIFTSLWQIFQTKGGVCSQPPSGSANEPNTLVPWKLLNNWRVQKTDSHDRGSYILFQRKIKWHPDEGVSTIFKMTKWSMFIYLKPCTTLIHTRYIFSGAQNITKKSVTPACLLTTVRIPRVTTKQPASLTYPTPSLAIDVDVPLTWRADCVTFTKNPS